MDDMREIVTVEQVNSLFLWLAIGLPVVGLIGGFLLGRRAGAIKGFVVGLFGPLNLLLWKVYNLITDKLGLDSVKNLLVQLGLFIALGVVGGLLFRRFGRDNGGSSSIVAPAASPDAPVLSSSA